MCNSGGCNKLAVFDWLANMDIPSGIKPFDGVEVRFKNSRKHFFKNVSNLDLSVGQVVAVESSPGTDIGVISAVGEIARLQMDKKNVNFDSPDIKKIYRRATEEDISTWHNARKKETETMHASRKMALDLNLEMKISDVEYQGDGGKATFYYTAEERVDFRQLIKVMAETFRVRIEMRQIGARQEASRLGGIGSCGRELCCSTWLSDFRSVSTSSARYQQLSLNPQKLAGQCGKLKCCLNYELDMYLEAYKSFPGPNTRLHTELGRAVCIKMDLFKRIMWFVYEEQMVKIPIPLDVDDVHEILAMNEKGKKPADLKDFVEVFAKEGPDYDNVVGQDSLTRFDNLTTRRKHRKKRKSAHRPDQDQPNEKEQSGGNSRRKSRKKNDDKKKQHPQAQKSAKPENTSPRRKNDEPKKNSQNNPNRKKSNKTTQSRSKSSGEKSLGNTPG